jgi:hypothetical protein
MIVNDLLKPSPLMATIMNQLNLMRNAYEGGTQFKRIVLLKKPSESPALYQDKLNNVASLPICKSMITELIDIIFDQKPNRELAFVTQNGQSLAAPPWFEDFLENADLQDNEFSDFMEHTATVAAVEGWAWVFVDLPEEVNVNNRPYLTLIPAQHVLDWKVFNEDGISTLTYLKVVEYQDDQCKRIKVWERGTVGGVTDEGETIPTIPTTATLYVVPTVGGTASVATVEPEEVYEFPADYPIPAVQVMPVKDIQNNIIGISDLTDVADMQREWLRLEAEAYDSIRFSKPIIRVDSGIKVPAGGGGIVHGAKDCMEVHAIPVMDVQQIREQQASLITSFDGYTGRGGTRAVAEQVQSGISIVEERKSLHKKAQTRARALEKVEQNILTLVCYMMGIEWCGDVEYNSDYEARDTQFKLALLQQAKALSMNPVIQGIIDQEVIRLIAPPDMLTKYLELVGAAKLAVNDVAPADDEINDNDDGSEGDSKQPMSGAMSSDAVQVNATYAQTNNMNKAVTGSL